MPGSARDFFTNHVIESVSESGAVDFSGDRIDVLQSRKSYTTYNVKETLEAKIVRLCKEVNEAKAEVLEHEQPSNNAAQEAGAKFRKDKSVLEGLESVLKQLQASTTGITNTNEQESTSSLAQKLYSNLSIGTHPSSSSNSKSKDEEEAVKRKNEIAQVAHLEERIARLEKIIGLAEANSTKESYRPILETLQDLKQRLKLLTSTPMTLDTSANNLRTLIASVEKLKSMRGPVGPAARNSSITTSVSTPPSVSGASGVGTGGNSDTQLVDPMSDLGSFDSTGLSQTQIVKINQLYSKLPLLERFEAILPKVLERIKCLRGIHADAESANASLKEMNSVILGLQTDLNSWQTALVGVEEKLQTFQVTSVENRKQIQEWVDDLKTRIK